MDDAGKGSSLNIMEKNRSKLFLYFFVLDFMLLNISFFTLNYLKKGTLRLSADYFNLLGLLYVVWIFISIIIKKFRPILYKSYTKGITIFTRSIIFILYVISFIVVITSRVQFSRVQIFGTCLLLLLLEIMVFSIYYEGYGKKLAKKLGKFNIGLLIEPKISYFILTGDFLLLIFSFFLLNFIKRSTFAFSPEYEKIFLIIIGLWFILSLVTRKFDADNFQNYFFALAACIKAVILMVLIISVVIYSFRLFYFSRFQIFGTYILFVVFESILYYLFFKMKTKWKTTNIDVDSLYINDRYFEQKRLPIVNNSKTLKDSSFMKILSERFIKSYQGLYDFVDNNIKIHDFEDSEIAIVNSPDRVHIKILEKNSLSFDKFA